MRVLVVEDEPRLRRELQAAIEAAGYAVDGAGDGTSADWLVQTERYDAVLLDLGLPGADGLALLRAWRDQGLQLAVLVVTARSSWHEKVDGIDSGADDYIAKPFRIEEVLARLRAVLRRTQRLASPVLAAGPIRLDPRTASVTLDGRPVRLTAHEYRVLAYLIHHAGRAVSQTELSEHIYPLDADRDSNTVEVFIARLRRKLGQACITTVRGLGYRVETFVP